MNRTPIITAHPLRRVAVDLTPVLPGGENGGAKVLTLELLRILARTQPDCEFILLTIARNDEELAVLDAPNMKRLRMDRPGPMLPASRNLGIRLKSLLQAVFAPRLFEWLAAQYQKRSRQIPLENTLLRRLDIDLLFCPFTAVHFYDPLVPVVSVVYDLQHRYFPQFFDPAEVRERDRSFQETCRLAQYIISISADARRTILENANIAPERVEMIPILLPSRLPKPTPAEVENTLDSLTLTSGRFLLFPANFWPHKNHGTLTEAFRMHLQTNPQSDLKLVLTGAPGPRCDLITRICRSDPLLATRVIFPGYLAEPQFSVLVHTCQAIIFPSLYEGFGMPLLEGMAAGKPLLVSNRTSLPEVAGDAALYFDPTRASEIAAAITSLERDNGLRHYLGEKAIERLRIFGGPEEMAARYLQVFRAARSADACSKQPLI